MSNRFPDSDYSVEPEWDRSVGVGARIRHRVVAPLGVGAAGPVCGERRQQTVAVGVLTAAQLADLLVTVYSLSSGCRRGKPGCGGRDGEPGNGLRVASALCRVTRCGSHHHRGDCMVLPDDGPTAVGPLPRVHAAHGLLSRRGRVQHPPVTTTGGTDRAETARRLPPRDDTPVTVDSDGDTTSRPVCDRWPPPAPPSAAPVSADNKHRASRQHERAHKNPER